MGVMCLNNATQVVRSFFWRGSPGWGRAGHALTFHKTRTLGPEDM